MLHLYQLTDEILNALRNHLLIDGIFCDLDKAIDCVNHTILISKLEFYGITGKHDKLCKFYLTNRYQRIPLYNENGNITTSTWAKIEHGVPQGSILGPLLFLTFINDLPKFVNDKSVPIVFADVTSILLSHSNPTDFNNNINTVSKILNERFKQNLLSLNFTKTQFTNFTTKNNNQTEININYNNKFIPTITYKKFLSLTVDCSLTWINHIDLLIKKKSTTCYLIRNIKPYLSISTLKSIYHSFFRSFISYGIMFWGNSSQNSVIFKMHKRVNRIMMGSGYRESCRGIKNITLITVYILVVIVCC